MGKKKIIGVDLFSGAGGMSLGAELAGISVKYAVEKNIHASETYKANHPHTKVINADVRELTYIPGDLGKGVSVLFGGAPCQGFSSSNRRTNNRDNPENWLYKEFIRVLNLWQPDWVVFENVTGIVEMESKAFFNEIVSDFEAAGYTCSSKILNSSDFGVPQKRSRLFLIGSKLGKEVNLESSNKRAKVTVKEAISDLPQIGNGANVDILPYPREACSDYAKTMRGDLIQCSGHLVSQNAEYVIERYKYIKQGQNWTSIPNNLMQNYIDPTRCHTGIYHRLREDDVAVVIGNYRKNMLIHPWSNRGLSVREAARLQSFPDSYVFRGSIGFQQQQVGNAVPPLLAKYIFDRLIEHM